MLYALTESDRSTLREVVRRVITEEFNIDREQPIRSRMITHIKEGLLDAELAAGDTTGVAMSVYTIQSGTWTDTTENITVKWPAGTIGATISASTWVVALWINGQWRPIAADC